MKYSSPHPKWKGVHLSFLVICVLQLPYFVNELTVTSIDMGSELPIIRNAGKPFLDNQGLWVEAEIVYAGGFTVSLETNVTLCV